MQQSNPLQPGFGPYEPPVLMNLGSYAWPAWLTEATGGRLEFEMLEPGSVFPGEEALKAIGSGAVNCAKSQGGYWAGTMPEMNVTGGMPGSWQSVAEQIVAWDTYGIYDKVAPLYDDYNVVFLPIPGMEFMNIFSTFSMPNPDSIKGKKIRTWGQWGKYIDLIGGSSVSMPKADVYMGLKLGTVDGAWTGCQSLETLKLSEVVTDFVINPNPCVDCILINRDSFEALPEDIQDLIMRESQYHFAAYGMMVYEQGAYVVANASKDYGLRLWSWSDEDIVKIRQQCVEEIWPEFAAKSPLCAELVEIIKTQMKDHGRL